MKLELSIPDEVAQALAAGAPELQSAAVEALALEGYRSRRLSEFQVQQLLGMSSRFQVHQFLKDHDVPLNYSLEDLRHDIATSGSFQTVKDDGKPNAA